MTEQEGLKECIQSALDLVVVLGKRLDTLSETIEIIGDRVNILSETVQILKERRHENH